MHRSSSLPPRVGGVVTLASMVVLVAVAMGAVACGSSAAPAPAALCEVTVLPGAGSAWVVVDKPPKESTPTTIVATAAPGGGSCSLKRAGVCRIPD